MKPTIVITAKRISLEMIRLLENAGYIVIVRIR